jgi:hypothetical protein
VSNSGLDGGKHQIPSSKSQINTKFQKGKTPNLKHVTGKNSNSSRLEFEFLVIGNYLEFDAWSLEFVFERET